MPEDTIFRASGLSARLIVQHLRDPHARALRVPLAELAGKVRRVPESSQLIRCGGVIGISMGR